MDSPFDDFRLNKKAFGLHGGQGNIVYWGSVVKTRIAFLAKV
jgi:hypothetical protein